MITLSRRQSSKIIQKNIFKNNKYTLSSALRNYNLDIPSCEFVLDNFCAVQINDTLKLNYSTQNNNQVKEKTISWSTLDEGFITLVMTPKYNAKNYPTCLMNRF